MNAPRSSFPFLQVLGLVVCVLGVLSTGAPMHAADAPATGTAPAAGSADVKIAVGHNDVDHESAEFKFKEVPAPVKTSAATTAKITIVDGEKDPNSADVEALNDGKLPSEEDEPASNFFFNAGTEGGRILIDLGKSIPVQEVNTYSWHTDTRAPQVYTLYAADGTAAGFNAKPTKDVDPVKAGWKEIAKVDTRPKEGEPGGQYGVSISGTKGAGQIPVSADRGQPDRSGRWLWQYILQRDQCHRRRPCEGRTDGAGDAARQGRGEGRRQGRPCGHRCP